MDLGAEIEEIGHLLDVVEGDLTASSVEELLGMMKALQQEVQISLLWRVAR